MSKMKKIVCALVVVLMVLAVLPAASMAQEAAYTRNEARAMKRWDNVWAYLDAVETQMMAAKANRNEVTMAVYKAALNCPLIDKGSITDLNDNEFSFTTDGMWGGYNYRVRNYTKAPAKQTNAYLENEVVNAVAKVSNTKNGPANGAVDVLLVGPFYGSDSSFTDQYKTEATSIANATGGTRTMLSGSQATGPAIAQNYPNKAVVIYDSHGNCIASNNTSYLDLTVSTGLTSSDYSNGWAYNGGSFYGIDGRYIKNHVSGTITNTFVWMAICEGMKKEGRGTTGTALLQAGCAAVYGYSQSVSFTGDYKYEAKFWTEMKKGATIANAIKTMKSTYGNWDPAYSSSSGAAWPIVMSPTDSFPSNPDGTQTVTCDWQLLGGSSSGPVALTSVSVANVNVKVGATAQVKVTVAPTTNVDYTITSYSSSNTSVATVSSSGVVTGKAAGTATLTVKVKDNVANTTYTKTATITVSEFEGYTLVSAPVSGGKYIIVSNGYAVGNTIYSNNHYLTSYAVTVKSDNTLTIPSSVTVNNILWTVGGSASAGWTFRNVGNSKYMGLDSSQYLYPSSTSVAWLYSGGDLNNQVDSDGYYYLSLGSSKAYFTTSKNTGNSIQFYQYVSGGSSATPTPAPTATPKPTATPTPAPTATPKPTATPAPTSTPTGTYYAPATSITTGVEYLIGYTDGTNTWLLMNYNPDQSNHYYLNSNSSYYGYAVRAVKSGNNVVGVDNTTFTTATLNNVTWKFVANGSYYKIQSGYNSSYYLRVYSSTRYADCYPASGTSYATKWQFTNNMLKYTVSSSTIKYATFYSGAADDYGFFGATTSGSNIVLFKKVG